MSNSKELYWFYQPCSVTIHAKTGSHYLYVWRAFIDSFTNCLKIYGPIYILTHLLNKKNFQFFIKKTLPNILRSSLFIAAYGSSFCGQMCLATSLTGRNYRIFSFLNAFLGSCLYLFIEKPHRRVELAVYVMNQAAETLFKMAVSRKLAIPIPGGLTLLFAMSWSVLVAFYKYRPANLGNNVGGLMKFFIGSEQKKSWFERIVSKTIPGKPNCKLCEHRGFCLHYSIMGFGQSFILAFLFKSVFGLLSLLVRPKVLFSNQVWRRLLDIALNKYTFRFSLFLGLLSGLERIVHCILKRVRGKEDATNSLIAGFTAGLSSALIQSPDISMWVVAKAAETLFRYAVDTKKIKPIKHGEVLLYSFCTAVLFYGSLWEPDCLRPSYLQFLLRTTGGRYDEYFACSHGLREEFNSGNWYKNGIF